ncbi:MAG: hypothetical protein KAG94_02010 [Clostridiales bacterium]|nr:hypothetical protein [Clostridiales bacterium]
MSDNRTINKLQSHYAFSYLSLKDGDYKQAIRGFNYSLKNNIEVEKSVIGLICAYSCLGKYQKAIVIFENHKHLLILNKSYRHILIHDLSFLLFKDQSALHKLRDGYFSSFLLGLSMKRTLDKYELDKSNVLAIIFLSYWYIVTGRRPDSADKILKTCLFFPTLDKDFRWKLLRRMSITNKELLNDTQIASKFSSIPKSIDSPEYVNQLILSSLFSKDLLSAQERIIQGKDLDQTFSNEVMWNYVKTTVELDAIDETTIFFARALLNIGWIDSYVSTAISFGYKSKSPYSAKKDIEKLQLFGL